MQYDVRAAQLPKRLADHFFSILKSARNRALRVGPALFAVAVATATLCAGQASAQTIVSVTRNPTSYSAAGQTINFTYVFNSGGYAVSSLSVSDAGTPLVSSNCTLPGNNDTGQTVNCTGSYVTKAGDIPVSLVSVPVFNLNGGQVTVTYNGSIQTPYIEGGPR
jgi:hypothetical protein